jgi:hypothetical protein
MWRIPLSLSGGRTVVKKQKKPKIRMRSYSGLFQTGLMQHVQLMLPGKRSILYTTVISGKTCAGLVDEKRDREQEK